ncbi:putative ribonuclease H-like domain-containing protein [Tanacetum coccineum]
MSKSLEEHGFVSYIQQRTNHKDLQNWLFACFLSPEEPKKVIHALKDPTWIEAMQEELIQFKLQKVWTLVDLPNRKRAIGTKWVFRNKKDEMEIVIRNKARLVAQGYTQEEGIDYDEVVAPIARIEAIRLFLAYASFKDFVVFEDPDFPDRVYKVKKTLYGLHQAPRAWYETLSTYLLDNEFQRGKIDKTLFIKRYKGDILLVQVYVDDIIFGSTMKELCNAFEKLVHEKFQMISMGELNSSWDYKFIEVKTASTPMETQKPLLKDEDGEEVDVHMYRSMIGSLMYLTSSRPDIMYLKGQPKLGLWYPKDSPFDLVAYTDSDYARASLDKKSTAEEKAKKSVRLMMEKLVIKENRQRVLVWSTVNAKTVNGEVQLQALMDGKKIIITESNVRRDLQLEYAEGVDCLPNATIFEQLALMGYEQQLEGMSNHNRIYVTPSHTKNIFGNIRRVGKGFSGRETPLFPTMVVHDQAEIGEGLANPTDPHHTPTFIQPSPQPQKTQKPRRPKKKDTQVLQSSVPSDNVADEAIYKELDDSLVRATTTASSLEANQDSGGGPRCQETMGDIIAQTRFENVSKLSNDLLLARGNTLRSGEDSLKLKELMELCTNLQIRVLDLEKMKTTQAEEIVSLKRRVKKLKHKKRSRTHGLKRLYKVGLTARVESFRDEESLGEDASKQGRINAIDADVDITLVNDQDDADMFDVNTLTGDEVLAEQEVAGKDVNLTVDEVTLAQALAALKSVKPKVKANVVKEPSVPVSAASTKLGTSTTTTTTSLQPSQAKVQDKGKGIMVEEHVKMKKKDQISFDEQEAKRLQAEFNEEERLAREKDKANVALTEEWDDIQAKVDADY